VRKLLVASQKGGVGKTAAAINLAGGAATAGSRVLLLDADPLSNVSTALNLGQHPHRQPLRQFGLDLPGILVPGVVPGLDVLSPYEDGCCSDEDLDELLRLLGSPAFAESYGALVIDSPPFMGANPAQLLGACDEFLLIMRAEPMAYRTLPAFLELVQRSRSDANAIRMRGILLTLPDGEVPGGRWERELRGRFGTRVLPQVIPHDEALGQALNEGRIIAHLDPEAAVSRQYHSLVAHLELAQGTRHGSDPNHASWALSQAASSLQLVGASARRSMAAAPPAELPAAEPEVVAAVRDDGLPRRPTPSGERRRLSDIRRRLPRERSTPPAPPVVPSLRASPPPPETFVERPSRSVPILPPVPPAAAPLPPPTPAPAPLPSGQGVPLWPLWILLGAILGSGVRFVPLSPSLIPLVVGLGVAIGVVFLLRVVGIKPDGPAAPISQAAPASSEIKPAPPRSEPRKDLSARLAALSPRPGRYRRGPHEN
jgi:cellulose biosynthesis protein BcsQ